MLATENQRAQSDTPLAKKVFDEDRSAVLVTVTVIAAAVPSGRHSGALQVTSLAAPVSTGVSSEPALADQKNFRGLRPTGSLAAIRKVMVPPSGLERGD
jgi:hypothetical protein